MSNIFSKFIPAGLTTHDGVGKDSSFAGQEKTDRIPLKQQQERSASQIHVQYILKSVGVLFSQALDKSQNVFAQHAVVIASLKNAETAAMVAEGCRPDQTSHVFVIFRF